MYPAMNARVTPASPVETLEPYVRSRLNPLNVRDWPSGPARSDFDLHSEPRPQPSLAPTPAAVLAALVERDAGLTVILTRRSDELKRH